MPLQSQAPAGYVSDDFARKSAALIVNSGSAEGDRVISEAARLLRASGLTLGSAYALDEPARIPDTILQAQAEGHELIILGGGDESVSAAVDSLVGREVVLGLLPLGTANDFARGLGIPADLEKACETIARGEPTGVNLCLVGGDYYVGGVSVGLGIGVIRTLSSQLGQVERVTTYPTDALKSFFRHRPFSATLTFPDGDHSPVTFERLLQIAIGNGGFYGSGMAAFPGPGTDDHTLDVYAIELRRERGLIGTSRYLKNGDFVSRECVSHYQTSRVRLDTGPLLPINADGARPSQTPQLFSVVPSALNVLVPGRSVASWRQRTSS